MPDILISGEDHSGHGGEIQLTDALQALGKNGKCMLMSLTAPALTPVTRWDISRPLSPTA